ncbi:Ig-like domain-containing protein [Shewanella putrefaciens]|uniref:Ig-like domain-containing protein n=1 Tax=Shewanella putrefaciens TaxID=24 RepID=UPI0018E8655C|nr:Ig-like domain-containing protein [Shewanella putrefaciens]
MRLSKTLAVFSWALLGALALSGCNGAADGTDTDGTTDSYSLTLGYKTVVNGKCTDTTTDLSFATDTSFCAVATLKRGSSKLSGQLVSFSATTGTVTPATKLTNADGIAEVIVSNPALTEEAGTVTASYTPSDAETLTASRNYEFMGSGSGTQVEPLKLSASILQSSALVTRFKVDEAVQLQAILLDSESQGIADAKVTFSAGSAVLNPASALTNNQGIAQVTYTPSATDLGANTLTVTVDYKGQSLQNSSLFEVLSKDAVNQEGTLKLGSFNGTVFTEGKLASTLTADANGAYKISAGGSFGVTASLVLEANDGTITRVQTPSSISFSSDCTTNNSATLDTPVTTLSGNASSTFQDTSCSGNSERNDQILATTVAGNQTLTASLPFTLQRQTLASLSFESAEPTQIRIKGAGGTGSSESSLVSFKVTSANGQPAAQQEVSFTLDTVVGGLSFANGTAKAQSLTNSQGIASVRVLSGTVPTPVRVVASAIDTDTNEVITSQSEQLTVNTGLPQQLGFSLATSNANPEAGNIDGEKVTVTARLSDSFGNPAPNDTTVNFTSEGGQIEPSCLTQNGACSVTWTSSDPRPQDHRITVLAYALGHETFFDTNGNNQFDSNDGTAIAKACLMNGTPVACSGNGLDVETFHSQGFSDLPTAFRDDNENFAYDSGERYFDNLASSSYKGADNKFNGPQCQGTLCGTGQANKTYVRKAVVMVMSGSSAYFSLWQDDVKVYEDRQGQNILNNLNALTAIPAGQTSVFRVKLYDSADQILPSSTTLNIAANKGELVSTAYTVPKTTHANTSETEFSLKNTGTASSQVVLTVKTPSGVETRLKFDVLLE